MRKKDRKSLIGYGEKELEKLSYELRSQIFDAVKTNGGHLSANLGSTDRTISLLRAFDPFYDDVLFDVGHQSYAFKLLTGRKLYHLRRTNGLAPFSLRAESKADRYDNGHAGDALSTARGRALRKKEEARNSYTVVVIGDASFLNGRTREALGRLSSLHLKRFIIVLNDNGRSIGKNNGFLSSYYASFRKNLSPLREDSSSLVDLPREEGGSLPLKSGDSFFSAFGLRNIGPLSGHDFLSRDEAFKTAKDLSLSFPVIVHLRTIKGYGYLKARKDQDGKYHCVGKGFPDAKSVPDLFQEKKAEYLLSERKKDKGLYLISPDSVFSASLGKLFSLFPGRCVNTGIGEENAIGRASGLRLKAKKAVVDLSSPFLQRGYDQVRENICRQSLSPLFFVEKAGLNGEDGESHQGLYDVSRLRSIPGEKKVRMPFDLSSLEFILKEFPFSLNGPLFVRLPGKEEVKDRKIRGLGDIFPLDRYSKGKYAFLGIGPRGRKVAEKRKLYRRFDAFRMLDLLPKPETLEKRNLTKYKKIFLYDPYSTVEGTGKWLSGYLEEKGYQGQYHCFAFANRFYPVGQNEDILKRNSLSDEEVYAQILSLCNRRRKKRKKEND